MLNYYSSEKLFAQILETSLLFPSNRRLGNLICGYLVGPSSSTLRGEF